MGECMVKRDGEGLVGGVDSAVRFDGELLEGPVRLRAAGGRGRVTAQLRVVGDRSGDRLANYQQQLHARVHSADTFRHLQTNLGVKEFDDVYFTNGD